MTLQCGTRKVIFSSSSEKGKFDLNNNIYENLSILHQVVIDERCMRRL
jgi:hypothetical protein